MEMLELPGGLNGLRLASRSGASSIYSYGFDTDFLFSFRQEPLPVRWLTFSQRCTYPATTDIRILFL
jgi:hypothetical protein